VTLARQEQDHNFNKSESLSATSSPTTRARFRRERDFKESAISSRARFPQVQEVRRRQECDNESSPTSSTTTEQHVLSGSFLRLPIRRTSRVSTSSKKILQEVILWSDFSRQEKLEHEADSSRLQELEFFSTSRVYPVSSVSEKRRTLSPRLMHPS
jgi:hypothetical protein